MKKVDEDFEESGDDEDELSSTKEEIEEDDYSDFD